MVGPSCEELSRDYPVEVLTSSTADGGRLPGWCCPPTDTSTASSPGTRWPAPWRAPAAGPSRSACRRWSSPSTSTPPPFRAGSLVERYAPLVQDGLLVAPRLDVAGYLASVERCRGLFPELRVVTGMEVGQPHRHGAELAAPAGRGPVDRVLGSLHCLPDGDAFAEPFTLVEHRPVAELFVEYLAEIPRMVAGSDAFGVLAHIDYPVRSWPRGGPSVRPAGLRGGAAGRAGGRRGGGAGAGDQHQAAAGRHGPGLVGRGGRAPRHLRQRRARAGEGRPRARGGRGPGGGARLSARHPARGPLVPRPTRARRGTVGQVAPRPGGRMV